MSGVSSALAAIVVFLIGWGSKPAMFRASRPNLHAGGAKALSYSGKTAPKQNKAEIEQLQPYAGQSNEKSCRIERA